MWHELIHMYLAGYVVAGFIVAGVYARGPPARQARRVPPHRPRRGAQLRRAGRARAGHRRRLGRARGHERQPIKLAAIEGLPTTTEGAPFTIGGWYDADDNTMNGGIEIPKLLSLLADHNPDATIQGLDTVPPDDRPPVNIVHYAFQIMVGIGTLLAALGALFVLTLWRHKRLPRSTWFYRGVVAAGPLALVALIAGWITTEVGRQPWIVYEVMRVEDSVTSSDGLELGFAVLVAVYLLLAVAVAWLLRRLSAPAPEREVVHR